MRGTGGGWVGDWTACARCRREVCDCRPPPSCFIRTARRSALAPPPPPLLALLLRLCVLLPPPPRPLTHLRVIVSSRSTTSRPSSSRRTTAYLVCLMQVFEQCCVVGHRGQRHASRLGKGCEMGARCEGRRVRLRRARAPSRTPWTAIPGLPGLPFLHLNWTALLTGSGTPAARAAARAPPRSDRRRRGGTPSRRPC